MAFCGFCGARINDGSRFCGNCGSPVEAPSFPETAVPTPAAAPEFPIPQQINTSPVWQAPSKPPAVPANPDTDEDADFFSVFAKVPQYPVQEEPPYVPAPAVPPVPATPTPEAAPVPPQTPGYYAAPQEESRPYYQTPASFPPLQDAPPAAMPQTTPLQEAPLAAMPQTTPLQEAPEVPRQAESRQKAPRKKAPAAPPQPRGALRIVASVLICILLLTALVPFFSLLTVRNTLHKDTIVALFHRIELDKIPMEQLDSYYEGDNMSLADLLCEEINEVISDTVHSDNWTQFTPQSLRRFMTKTTFPDFIAEHTEGVLQAFLSGKRFYSIDAKDVEDVLLENLDYITGDLGLILDEDDIHIAARQFVEAGSLDKIELPDLDGSLEEALAVARITLSVKMLLPAILALVVFVGLLFLTNLKQPIYALRDVGIVCIIGTVLPLLSVIGCRSIIDRAAGTDAAMYLGSVVVSCILERGLTAYIVTFAAGVVILIAVGIVRMIRKKRAVR